MVAAVEVYGEQATFASRRVPAWHALGTVFQEDVDSDEMLKIAHMDKWNVRLEEITLPARSKTRYFATVRDNPLEVGEKDVLGVVRERYNTFQNEELFAFADSLLVGGRWETAGSIKDGKVVFGSLALDHEMVIDPTGVADKIESYLLVHSSHDGSLSIQASITPTRVVCQNTLNIAISNAVQSFKVRHTEKAGVRVADAAAVLGLTDKYLTGFEVEAKALYAQAVTDDQFYAIVKAAYEMPDDANVKGAMTKWQNKADALFSIYNGETGTANARGTAWGAYNALTERLDWGRKPRGGNAESVYAAASGFDAATNAEKNRLLTVVKGVLANA